MKKIVLLVLLVSVLAIVFGTWALAATPQDIYDDWADNGRLDNEYTEAELRAFLNDATLRQYPPDATTYNTLRTYVNQLLAARDRFPFTGVETGLMVAGVVVLLGTAVGVGLRKMSQAKG